jgi:hypothetical protein
MEGSEQTQAHVPWFFFGIRLANRVASVSNGLGKLMSRAASPNGRFGSFPDAQGTRKLLF